MKVILNKDVSNIGEEGDVCEVARGYARNYLLPRGLGLQYNSQNLAVIEQRRASIEKRKDEKRKAAMGIKERLENEELVFTMASGDKGQLFGSVNSQGVAERLEKLGIDVERRKIDVPEGTIKSLGRHTVKVKLYGGEEANLTVVVTSQATGKQSTEETAPEGKSAKETAESADSAVESEDKGSEVSEEEEAEASGREA